MCPSTSCGTRRGSQFGTWLATAVISPKLNEARPSTKRMKTSARRRSLRIRRRRKQGILALDAQKRLLRRRVDAARALDRDQHARARPDRPLERNGDERPAAEGAGRLRRAAGADPRLIGLPPGRLLQVIHDEGSPPVLRNDQHAASERDRARARRSQDRRDLLFARELLRPPVELARQ